jgi:hypothetical protein
MEISFEATKPLENVPDEDLTFLDFSLGVSFSQLSRVLAFSSLRMLCQVENRSKKENEDRT